MFKHIRALEIGNPTSKSFATPIETQIKPPIIKLPFLILASEESLKMICNKIINNFDDYLKSKEEADIIASIQDTENKRYAEEQFFSEWVYELVNLSQKTEE